MPPSEKSEGLELWNETWKRVDRFLPDLFGEIFPEADQSLVPPPAAVPPLPPTTTRTANPESPSHVDFAAQKSKEDESRLAAG